MTAVTKEDFYAYIGPLNVHPRLEGDYPYTARFLTTDGTEKGRSVPVLDEYGYSIGTSYLIPEGAKS